MTALDLWLLISGNPVESISLTVLIILSIIQISPIKINPFTTILAWLGGKLNKNMEDKIDILKEDIAGVKEEVANVRAENAEESATLCRARILRFGDEIVHNIPHSKEHYDQILLDIDKYDNYCLEHPNYKNNLAVQTIKHIKKKYQEHLDNDTFLK